MTTTAASRVTIEITGLSPEQLTHILSNGLLGRRSADNPLPEERQDYSGKPQRVKVEQVQEQTAAEEPDDQARVLRALRRWGGHRRMKQGSIERASGVHHQKLVPILMDLVNAGELLVERVGAAKFYWIPRGRE